MREFILTCNSTVDMPKEWLQDNKITMLPLKYTLEGKTYTDKDDSALTPKQFFDELRAGHMSVTSQINAEEAKEFFEPILKEGKDILHLSFSSGLSGTYNSTRLAAVELRELYPEAKITVVDTLCACMGEGLLLHNAIKLRDNGMSLDDLVNWCEENKLRVNHFVTVDDLNHLHRGGRVSKLAAVAGTMLQMKPILAVDNNGKLGVIGKERGRKKSIAKIVDLALEASKGVDNDLVLITHGDCLEDAQYLASLVEEKLGISNILINTIGTVIGSHTGPGVLSVFVMGKERPSF